MIIHIGMNPERDFMQYSINNGNANASTQKSMTKIINLTSRTG
jgi:hypothetical protein